jgi:hypothetical protein
MAKFVPLNRRNGGCPVCNSSSGKCKEQGELILCMESSGDIQGLIYLGQTKNGTWGQYKFDDGDNEQYQRPERIPEPEGIKLPAKERDAAIKSIIQQLPLDERDKQDLIRRGLTVNQIYDWGFVSISKDTKLEAAVNPDLAGIAIDGKHTCIHPLDAGYFIPTKDINGLYVGGQLKVRKPRDDEGKYKWLKSGKNARRERDAVSHTAEFNELPLQHSIVNNTPGQPLYLTEGTGKPLYASLRFNINVIGASGGNFLASIETLINSLDILKPSEIILGADSGSRINPHVIRLYRALNHFLKPLGYQLLVADWGQGSDKSQPDIDELSSPDWDVKPYESWDVASKIPANQIFDNNLDWKQKRIEAAHYAWKNNKRYTPNITHDEDYCISPPAPRNGEGIALKYHTGQGKSTWIKNKFKNEFKGFGAIKLGSRNSLEYQFSASSDFYHLKDDDGKIFINDPKGRTTSCIDSILNYDDSDADGKKIVIDEAESIAHHTLYGGTLKERQQQVINKLRTLLQRCDGYILADGNLTDATCEWFKELSGKPLTKYYNKRVPKRPKVILYDDVNKNQCKKLANQIIAEAFFWAMFDSQIDCEAMEKVLLKAGRKPLRIDSKTINDPILGKVVKRFLENPDLFLLENEITKIYDCILTSPTVESGLDCNYKGFSGVYLFATHLDINKLLQLIIRVRDVTVPRYVCCSKFVRDDEGSTLTSPFTKILERSYSDIQKESIESLGPELGKSHDEIMAILHQQLDAAFNTPEQKLFTTYQAIRNYERANYRDCFIESLQNSGYEVEITQIGKTKGNSFKACKKEVKQSVADDVTDAAVITEPEYKSMSKRQDLDWKERCSVTKFRLLQRLPNIGTDWTFGLVYHLLFENKKLISQAENRWILNNPELAVKRSKKAWHGVVKYDKTFLGNFKTLLPMIKEFNRLGVRDILDRLAGTFYDNTTPDIKELWDKWGRVQEMRTGIARGANPTTLVKRLGVKLGYEAEEVGRSADNRYYTINDLLADDVFKRYTLFEIDDLDPGENPPTSIGAIVAKCVNERLESENLDPGLTDDDWLEILQTNPPKTSPCKPFRDDKPIDEYIIVKKAVCHPQKPNPVTVTDFPLVEISQPEPEPQKPEPIDYDKIKVGDRFFDKAGNPYQITKFDIRNNMWETNRKDVHISRNDIMNTDDYHRATVEPTPEPITIQTPTPEPIQPQSWKGAMGRIKTAIPEHWKAAYTFISTGKNPLLEAIGRTFKAIDNAPVWKHNAMAPGGGGWVLLGTIEGMRDTNSIPIDCLEFEGI